MVLLPGKRTVGPPSRRVMLRPSRRRGMDTPAQGLRARQVIRRMTMAMLFSTATLQRPTQRARGTCRSGRLTSRFPPHGDGSQRQRYTTDFKLKAIGYARKKVKNRKGPDGAGRRYAARRLEILDKSTLSSWMKDESKLRQSVETAGGTRDIKGEKQAAKKRSLHIGRPPTNEIVNGLLVDWINELRWDFHDQEQSVRVQAELLRTLDHCNRSTWCPAIQPKGGAVLEVSQTLPLLHSGGHLASPDFSQGGERHSDADREQVSDCASSSRRLSTSVMAGHRRWVVGHSRRVAGSVGAPEGIGGGSERDSRAPAGSGGDLPSRRRVGSLLLLHCWNQDETPGWFETVGENTVAVSFVRLLVSPCAITVLY